MGEALKTLTNAERKNIFSDAVKMRLWMTFYKSTIVGGSWRRDFVVGKGIPVGCASEEDERYDHKDEMCSHRISL